MPISSNGIIPKMNGGAVLKVRMFGGFQMSYRGEKFQIGKKQTAKAVRLLQMLLHAGAAGIAREQLLEDLFGHEAETDLANNLNVTVHYLRKLLKASRLPEGEYILIKSGRYHFDAHCPVEVDVLAFASLLEQAKGKKEDERLKLLKEACRLYKGHFLPALTGEEWATVTGAHYQYLYTDHMEEVCRLMTARGEYQELFDLCGRAAAVYPFDEWQIWQMECLLAMKRFEQARELYDQTEALYLNELDAAPMERMTEFFQKMSQEMRIEVGDLNQIQMDLQEEGREDGAYYCSYLSFVDTYRTMCRVMERSGQSIYLLLCVVSDEREKVQGGAVQVREVSEQLAASIREVLRRGDVFTRYNKRQFLVLLIGIRKEECPIIINRIDASFRRRVNCILMKSYGLIGDSSFLSVFLFFFPITSSNFSFSGLSGSCMAAVSIASRSSRKSNSMPSYCLALIPIWITSSLC